MGRRGMTIGLPYVHAFTDRHGHQRFYFRRHGRRTKLPGNPGSAEFLAAYTEARSLVDEPKVERRLAPRAGSFAALAERYYQSTRYKRLAESSRTNYRRVVDSFLVKHGHRLVRQMTPGHVETLVSEYADRPGAGIVFLKRLRGLLSYAVKAKWITVNPASGAETFKSTEYHTWTEDEIEQFQARWPLGTKQRLGLELHLCTGQRGSDVCRMAKPDKRGQIRVVQKKTKNKLTINAHPDMVAALAALPTDHVAAITTDYGQPFSVKGFGQFMSAAIRKAGLPKECVAHGLRKAAGRRLAEAGCTAHEIMAVLGLKTLAEAERYTRDAEQEKLNKAALEKQVSGLPKQKASH